MMKRIAALTLFGVLCACAAPPRQVAPVPLPAAPPRGEPEGLVGMRADAVRAAFGRPAFIRKDGVAQMWRYDGTACKAFFFLYPDGETLAVRHVETLPRGARIAADANCLAELRADANPPVS